jgi:hypothetical protein
LSPPLGRFSNRCHPPFGRNGRLLFFLRFCCHNLIGDSVDFWVVDCYS